MTKEQEKQKQKKKILLASGCAVLAAVGIGTAVFLNMDLGKNGLELEANATVGEMPGVDEETRRKQLQEILDKSKIAFSINTSPMFDNKTGEMNLLLENPSNNAKLITAQIVLAGQEKPIYESKALVPGSYLESVALDKPLSPGTYDAIVYLNAYDEETQELIGQTGAQIKIISV